MTVHKYDAAGRYDRRTEAAVEDIAERRLNLTEAGRRAAERALRAVCETERERTSEGG